MCQLSQAVLVFDGLKGLSKEVIACARNSEGSSLYELKH
jgi:hypothetical protein